MDEQSAGPAPLALDRPGNHRLVGTDERTVDDKGRIVLPSGPHRDVFDGWAWITVWLGCLAMWTRQSFDDLLLDLEVQERAGVIPSRSVESLRAAARQVAVDSQGRVAIPADLRAARGIGGHGAKVLVEGQSDRLELRPVEAPDQRPDVETVIALAKHR